MCKTITIIAAAPLLHRTRGTVESGLNMARQDVGDEKEKEPVDRLSVRPSVRSFVVLSYMLAWELWSVVLLALA